MKYIAVLDCNNFFVSCERLFRPDLRRCPVLVLSNNDGCVVARSQEVKDMGVVMGIPVFQIKDIIKDKGITTFSSNFTLYRDISGRVMTVLKSVTTVVEQYSIDEAFFAIEANTELELVEMLKMIKKTVEQSVGIPVSIGVAATKTQAKHINKLAKKLGDGVMVGDETWWREYASSIPIREIWGVGRRLSQQYANANIATVADLLDRTEVLVGRDFGVVGIRLQAELRGRSQYGLETTPALPKSIMSTRSFGVVVRRPEALKDALAFHVGQVASQLRAKKLAASTIVIIMRPSRYSDFFLYPGVQTLTLTVPSNRTSELLREVFAVVDQLFRSDIPYKKAGIVVSGLIPTALVSRSLFTGENTDTPDVLDSVVDQLQGKYGTAILQRGRQLNSGDWHAKRSFISPAYTTRWTDIKSVKT